MTPSQMTETIDPNRSTFDASKLPESAALAEWAKQNADVKTITLVVKDATGGVETSIPMLVAPAGYALHSVKGEILKYRTRPESIVGTANFSRPDSFAAHARRFGREGVSVMFAERSTATVTAIYDYHATTAPSFCRHRATCTFVRSAELNAWQSISGKEMTQENFAAFVENHLPEILDPAAVGPESKANDVFRFSGLRSGSQASLTSLTRNLFVRVETTVAEVRRQDTGEVKMIFEQATKGADGGPLTVPAGFFVGIPLFEGDETAMPLAVRLTMRLKDGKVLWTCTVQRIIETFDAALMVAVNSLSVAAGLPVFWGSPER